MQNSTLKMMIAGGAVLVSANAAQAWIADLDVPAEKASFGQLKDIYKQGAKFTACTVKAAVSCESKYGTTVIAQDCVMATAMAPVAAGTSFSDALGKCEGKVDYLKKSATGDQLTDYQGMQCPGDSNSSLAGIQPYVERIHRYYAELEYLRRPDGTIVKPTDPDIATGFGDELLFTGTPEQVAESVLRYIEVGVNRFHFRVSPGGLPRAWAERSIRLFGEQVLPIVRSRL